MTFSRCVVCLRLFLRVFCFFFFKQKTAYEMRISDWSSDVCSSDLSQQPEATFGFRRQRLDLHLAARPAQDEAVGEDLAGAREDARTHAGIDQDRTSVV